MHLRMLSAAALLFAAPAMATVTPPFTATPANGFVIVVNQNSGAITACFNNYTGNFVPDGTCQRIGTATPTTTATEPSLIVSYSSLQSAYVTNTYTGKIWQCVVYNQYNVVGGSCILEGTAQ